MLPQLASGTAIQVYVTGCDPLRNVRHSVTFFSLFLTAGHMSGLSGSFVKYAGSAGPEVHLPGTSGLACFFGESQNVTLLLGSEKLDAYFKWGIPLIPILMTCGNRGFWCRMTDWRAVW